MKKGIILIAMIILLSTFSLAIPNPAAKFCIEKGNTYKVKSDAQGNDYGVCVSRKGEEKDEWEFYKSNKVEVDKQSISKADIIEKKVQMHSRSFRSKEKVIKALSSYYTGSLPPAFDWRDNKGNWLTPVKNQGGCGSCWAFAAVGVAESKVNIELGNADYNIDLSEQDLVSCDHSCYPPPDQSDCQGGCGGGYIDLALDYMKNTGIVRESCFGYTSSNNDCSNKCQNWNNELVIIDYDETPVPASESAIKQAIVNNGPVTVSMVVCGDFNGDGVYSHSGNVFSDKSCWTIVDETLYLNGHGINIVGYNDAGQYWICKNSWGSGWGDNGYFKIAYSESIYDFDSWWDTGVSGGDSRVFFLDDSYALMSTDIDNDGVGDAVDNCYNISNPDQANSDSDSLGDVCDNCPDVSNPDQTDSDGDGIGDACESTVTRHLSTDRIDQGSTIDVTLSVDIFGVEGFYIIDELIPQDMTVTDAGTGNTDEAGHIKWFVTSDIHDTNLVYTLQDSSGTKRNAAFSGTYIFQSDPQNELDILGDTILKICTINEEVCDGVDNDCDGLIDEDLTQSCGSGNCQGTETCIGGQWSDCDSEGNDAGVCAICDADGNEVYGETQDADCNQYDLSEIATCTNNPDNNPFTWDYASAFDSICFGLNQCTQDSYSYTHSCDTLTCGAECEQDNDCPDKCAGDDYWTSGSCTEDCSCFYAEEDCNQYDSWQDTSNTRWVDFDDCNEKEQKEQEYRDYTCGIDGCEYSGTNTQWVDTDNTRNKADGTSCDDSQYCTVNDQCTSGVCDGDVRDCSDGVSCTVDLCNENTDSCDNSPDDTLCDDGVYCNGEEYCDAINDCQEGTPIDCSPNDLPEIDTCFNDPDNNTFTWDYADEFESTCDEINNECTEGMQTLTHECSTQACNAECESDGDCTETICSYLDGCYDGTYQEYAEVENTCLGNCSCTNNTCTDYVEIITDLDNDTYDTECDNDCENNNADINPGAEEVCDGVDNDCDDIIDEGFFDSDNDGIADCIDPDDDNDGITDENDPLTGDSNSINSTTITPVVEIDGSTDLGQSFSGVKDIVIKDDNETIIEFQCNFSKDKINLFNVTINKQEDNTEGSIIITGISLPEGETKTVYIDDLSATSTLCIKDQEIASISEINSNCDGAGEVSITCTGTAGNYNCTDLGDRYKVTGLKHSGVQEYTYVAPPSPPSPPSPGGGGGGGGGGGSSCKPEYTCRPISQCLSTGKIKEVCTDTVCNKGSYRQTVNCTYIPPRVLTTTQEEPAEEPEETLAAVAPSEETPPAPTPGMLDITGAAIGTAYQQRPLTMGGLTVFILAIIGLFIYSHAKNLKHLPFHFKHPRKWLLWLVIAFFIACTLLFIHFVLLSYFKGP